MQYKYNNKIFTKRTGFGSLDIGDKDDLIAM